MALCTNLECLPQTNRMPARHRAPTLLLRAHCTTMQCRHCTAHPPSCAGPYCTPLLQVKGIGPKKALDIKEQWEQNSGGAGGCCFSSVSQYQ